MGRLKDILKRRRREGGKPLFEGFSELFKATPKKELKKILERRKKA